MPVCAWVCPQCRSVRRGAAEHTVDRQIMECNARDGSDHRITGRDVVGVPADKRCSST